MGSVLDALDAVLSICLLCVTFFVLYSMSSAYVVSWVCLGGGMSEVYMLKSVGERTPVLNWRWVDVVFLNVVLCSDEFSDGVGYLCV